MYYCHLRGRNTFFIVSSPDYAYNNNNTQTETNKWNALWIRNCSAYSEPMTLRALVRPAGSRQTLLAETDAVAAILKV